MLKDLTNMSKPVGRRCWYINFIATFLIFVESHFGRASGIRGDSITDSAVILKPSEKTTGLSSDYNLTKCLIGFKIFLHVRKNKRPVCVSVGSAKVQHGSSATSFITGYRSLSVDCCCWACTRISYTGSCVPAKYRPKKCNCHDLNNSIEKMVPR